MSNPPDVIEFLEFGTGCWVADVMALRWDVVDLDSGT